MICSDFNSQIDSYLNGEIAEEKRETFELHFFECDDCFTELKIRERLFSKEIPIVTAGKKSFWAWGFKPMLVLSSLLIVVVSTLLVVQNYRQAEFLTGIAVAEPPAYIQSETRNTFQNESFSNAMTLYNKKQYHDVLTLLDTMDTQPNNPQVIFFKGICRLEINDPETAVTHFDIIIKEMNPSYYDEAIFYKGIALLRLNKKNDALKQFQNLASMFSPYSKQAKDIIDKIKK
ncbi:MAG: zf-HC2 domain-containing protein [bacterium]|nr:zf-HC2 domain-containing protein [bacterium]